MRIIMYPKMAIAFNDYAECAKIEGYLFKRLIVEAVQRKQKTNKTEKVIIREIVESWPRDALKWLPISEANK